MANIENAFPVVHGLSLDDNVGIFDGTNDPSANNEVAPIGSLYLRDNGGSSGELWVKVGTADSAWERAITGSLSLDDLTDVDTTTDAPVTGDLLVYNGTEWVPDSSSGAPPASSKDYVFAYDTTTQNITAINTYQNVNFSTNAQLEGWTHTPGTANFTASKSGLFAASVEFNVEKNGGGNVEAGVRTLFNGSPILGSQNGMDLTSNNTAFSLSRTFLFIATAGQDLIVQLSANNTTASIVPSPNPGGATFVSATITIRRLT